MLKKWNRLLVILPVAGILLLLSGPSEVSAKPAKKSRNNPVVQTIDGALVPARPDVGVTIATNPGEIQSCYVEKDKKGKKGKKAKKIRMKKSKHFVGYSECIKHRGGEEIRRVRERRSK